MVIINGKHVHDNILYVMSDAAGIRVYNECITVA